MKVAIIPIVIGAFGTVTKGLLKGLEDLEVSGRVEAIQTTAFLKMARILSLKMLAKIEKELEFRIQTIRICRQNIETEFSKEEEKFAMLIMKKAG